MNLFPLFALSVGSFAPCRVAPYFPDAESDSDCSVHCAGTKGSSNATRSTACSATPVSSEEVRRLEKQRTKEHTQWKDTPRAQVAAHEEELPDDELMPRSLEEAVGLIRRLNSKILKAYSIPRHIPTSLPDALKVISKMQAIIEQIEKTQRAKTQKKPNIRRGESPSKNRALDHVLLRLKIQTHRADTEKQRADAEKQRADAAEKRCEEVLNIIEMHLADLGN